MSQDDFSEKVGLPPGTVVHTGEERAEEVIIKIMEFHQGQMREYIADTIDDCRPPIPEDALKWVHVVGVHDVELVQRVCSFYEIHPLIVEDIPSVGQRPKIEGISSGVYIVLRAYDMELESDTITSEQVSIVFGKGFVLSFQESPKGIFEPIRERARRPKEQIRTSGSDYLTYALLDLIVDRYFIVLERVGDIIEDLEDALIERGDRNILNQIYHIKRSLLVFRRHIWPLREVALKLQRDFPAQVENTTHVYLRDLYDHVIRVTDLVETYRESITGMLDIYLSSVSNRMNEVMKVLTVASTIVIPLMLMASLYGMNWPWFNGGDYIVLAINVALTFVLLAGFRRLKWI
jgi:magnesium transporter